jgi:ArsR family transcriptional regulator, virulence genes transcriptional regulator
MQVPLGADGGSIATAIDRCILPTMPDDQLDPKKLARRAAEATAFLRSVASRPRLMVLCSLVEHERSSGDLARRLGLSPSNLSQHLAVLRKARLVVVRRQRSNIFYRLASDRSRRLLAELYRMFCSER